MKRFAITVMLIVALAATGCEMTPYDYDDPGNQRDQQRKSCDRDPYQDQCRPGF